ncbi:MAG TPA: dienelactone hydrolase family protein [Rhizomicrobium sp.]|jgi:dienelactone hydrolase|nr:dienelactone hydrolase family protein [Rhizomicrobium sp.]
MKTEHISYEVDGTKLVGYLADEETRGPGRPGVLVVHQGRGLAEHTKERARMLAELGYVAFALGMFGETPRDMQHAMQLLQQMRENPALLRRRAIAGLDKLKAQPNVDATRLAAIGYCFGGVVVLELARLDAGLAAIVAFHPALTNLPERDDRKISAKIMVCAGDEDPLIPVPSRENFAALMRASSADWQLLLYGGAGHSFTDKDVDALNMKGFSYHASTDRRSWAAMRELLEETLAPRSGYRGT